MDPDGFTPNSSHSFLSDPAGPMSILLTTLQFLYCIRFEYFSRELNHFRLFRKFFFFC